MPTYEYACEACENAWEIEQRITEEAIRDCPKCNQPKARRLISGSRFVLKGGGWYADGYGSSKPKSADKAETKSESKADTKGETSSSAKPENSAKAESSSSDSKPSAAAE